MAIVATLSKFKKTNYKIIIAVLVLFGVIFAYDGYLSKYEWSMRHNFYQEHVIDNGGEPDSDMIINRKAPLYLIGAAVLVAAYFLAIRNKKVIADEKSLIVGKKVIPYDWIEQIDKTHFDSKGWFVVIHKNDSGSESSLKLSDKTYDNLSAVLDELARQIS